MALGKLQYLHGFRYLRQVLRPPNLAVIGGYHFGNLGDMALGFSIYKEIRQFTATGLQTIYNLDAWPRSSFAILGGGAIIHRDTLDLVFSRYLPSKVAFCGVDIEDWEALSLFQFKMYQLPYLSLRSTHQLERLKTMFPGISAVYHPDIVFSLADHNILPFELPSRQSVAIINVTPRFHMAEPDTLCYDEELSCPTPFGILADGYTNLIRRLATRLTDLGLQLIHIPFTPADGLVARDILNGYNVNFCSYSASPVKVLSAYKTSSFSFGSRYHSMIFSMISGAPFSAFAYASKSARLIDDMKIDSQKVFAITDLLDQDNLDSKIDSVVQSSLILDRDTLSDCRSRSHNGIQMAIHSLGLRSL